MTCPSVMLPSRNFGAQSRTGTTGANRLDPCDTSAVRMCWPVSSAHCLSTWAKVLVDAAALLLLAAEQGDALAVFAHARQRVAEFGFRLVLLLGELDEMAADDHHRGGGDRGIDHRGDDEEAGNGDGRTCDRQSESPADRPEHHDEGRGRQKCGNDASDEIDRRLRWQSANPPRCGLRGSCGRR